MLNIRRLSLAEAPDFERLSLNQLLRKANRAWHGVKLGQPDWRHSSHSLAFTAEARNENLLFHMILNAYWEPLDFELPPADHHSETAWRRWIDTALDSPHEIEEWQAAPVIPSRTYRAGPHSLVVLFAQLAPM
jgi:glycogen operon protein